MKAALFSLLMLTATLKPGDDIMPFTSNVVTGPYRGMQHCYVCDAKGAQTCMVAFFGQADDASAKFAAALKPLLIQSKEPPLAWFVYLTEHGSGPEALHEDRVERLAQKAGLTRLNLTVLGDPQGPPGYLVDKDSALTVLVYKRFIVKQVRVYPKKDWSEATAAKAAEEVLKLIDEVTKDPTSGAGPAIPPGPPPGFDLQLKKE